MAKKPYTLTLDEEVAEKAQELTDNFSGLVTSLLRELVSENERKQVLESISRYDEQSEERRERLGMFSDEHRKFL